MNIQIVDQPISIKAVSRMSQQQFGDMIKAAVDVQTGIMAIGGELHADEEQVLLEQGSNQQNLWGINLYPANFLTDQFIQFDSMINIKPSQKNRSRAVENPLIQQQIRAIVSKLVLND